MDDDTSKLMAAMVESLQKNNQQGEPRLFRWVEALGPALVVLMGGGVAYGGVKAQMDTHSELLGALSSLPVQVAELRAEIASTAAGIRIDQGENLGNLAQRIATVEQRSTRSYENISRLFDIARANEGKIDSIMRTSGGVSP